MSRPVIVLLLIPLLWACAPARPVTSNLIEQNPRLPMALNMKYATLTCADGAACPENVGYLLANAGESMISQCTGWLVAPDIVATNSHCIPDEMKKDAAKCVGNMSIKLPATKGLPEEILDCARVLYFSPIAEKQGDDGFIKKADYAFFRLTRPSRRKVIAVSREGIHDQQDLTVFSVDPQSRQEPVGKLFKRVCRPYKNTLLLPEDTTALADVSVAFGDGCVARHGNSGSPVLNSRGEAVGWLHGGIMEDTDLERVFPDQTVLEGKMKRAAILTNAACVPALATVSALGALPARCAPEARRELAQKAAQERNVTQSQNIVKGVSLIYGGWLAKATNVLKFRSAAVVPVIKGRGVRFTIEPSVECVLPAWSAPTAEAAYAQLPAKDGATGALRMRLQKPTIQVEMKFDVYWRVQFRVSRQAPVNIEFNVDPTKVRACTPVEAATPPPLHLSFAAK